MLTFPWHFLAALLCTAQPGKGYTLMVMSDSYCGCSLHSKSKFHASFSPPALPKGRSPCGAAAEEVSLGSGGPLPSGIAHSYEQLHAVQACATAGCVHGGHGNATNRLQIKRNSHRGCIRSYFKVWQTEMKMKHRKLVVKLKNSDAGALTWSHVPKLSN